MGNLAIGLLSGEALWDGLAICYTLVYAALRRDLLLKGLQLTRRRSSSTMRCTILDSDLSSEEEFQKASSNRSCSRSDAIELLTGIVVRAFDH